ncbi:MAG: asparagine synthase (glutamine-hydrolyzing) [Bacteroidota bacterium]
MCGICGIIDSKQKFSRTERANVVKQVNIALQHRGPDEAGYFDNEIASLAMRRLSIIDLSGGQQPIWNESKNVLVFFNGEIYNHLELREKLEQKGHHFQTQTDTEVLVHLYEEHGTDMLLQLKGMFAFCIHDQRQQSFFLARDRFGEKPLYYHWDGETLSFASEVAALLENKGIPRRLNVDALPYYFRTSLVPEPMTLLQDVQSLPAGHYIQLADNQLDIKPYFKINYRINPDIKREEDALDMVRPLLQKAVERQTVSDVPVGAFLSGGIDSSTVVALLQQQSSRPIQTFNVRFEEQAYDESAIAREVADYCGTEHHELTIPNADFTEGLFWEIIDHVGLPFRDSSAIPTYLISKAIRQHVKVALSGDGGDELFGGYDIFQWYQTIVGLQKIPRPLRYAGNVTFKLAQQIPGLNQQSKLRQLQRVSRTSLLEESEIPLALNEFYQPKEIQNLLTIQNYSLQLEQLKDYPKAANNWSPLRRIMYHRTKHTLPSNMLIKVDRMSMANSLEVRAPFLDPDLFEAAAQLPDKYLIHKGKGKYLIRQLMKDQLPDAVFSHPKMGFGIPLYKYQNEAYKQLAHRLLFEDNPLSSIFDMTQLKTIFHQAFHLQKNTAKQSVFQSAHRLWMLMQLIGWAKRFNVTVD